MQNIINKSVKGYKFDNNSFIRPLKAHLKDKIEVEVGDIKQEKFFPQIKLKRWNNDLNLSVRLSDITDENESINNLKDKIVWKQGKREAHFYEKPKDAINEDGAYEFEVILNEKPSSNIVEFSINTKNLDFFYQPELTEEEISNGMQRAENVIGSYAVYHKFMKGNFNDLEYKTGKAFHIYRPEIVDADGKKVWGKLSIDIENGKLFIIIPQEFLDNAQYPVIVDPTFGNTSIGGSTSTLGLNRYLMNKQTLASNAASVDSIAVYGNSASGTIGIDVLYYTDVAGTPTTRRNVKQSTITTSLQWRTFSFASPVSESAATFWLGVIFSNTFNYYFDATGGVSINTFVNSSYSNQGSNPYDGSGGGGTLLVSIYANYTAAAVVLKNRMMMGMG